MDLNQLATTPRPGSPRRARHLARALVLLALAALTAYGCGASTSEALQPVSFAGTEIPEAHPMALGDRGGIYLRGRELAPGELVAAVIEHKGTTVVGAVFQVLEADGELARLAKIADTGGIGVVGTERYVALHELPAGATGIRVLRASGEVPASAIGGWYWIVRPMPDLGAPGELPGLYRVVEGVAVVGAAPDGAAQLEVIAGELADGAWLVELWPRTGVGREPIDIALMLKAGDVDDASLARSVAAQLEQDLAQLGVAGRVELIEVPDPQQVELMGLPDASGSDVAVVLGEPWRIVAQPRSFLVERLEPLAPLAQLGLLEHPLWLPATRDPELLARATLGIALMRGATVPIGTWLVEEAARAGASLSASEMALRWRLSEAYALSRQGELAREIIARLGATAPAAAADAVRYAARVAHLELVDNPSADAAEDALALYDRAIEAYVTIGFLPGAADTLSQKASLQLVLGRIDEALASMSDAAERFAAAGVPRLAGRALMTAAVQELARGGADAVSRSRARVLFGQALEHFTDAGDTAGVAGVAAWQAVVAETLPEAAAHLELAMTVHGTGSVLEPVLVLGEATRESLAGRHAQARASWLDAAARAAGANLPRVEAIALARLVDDLEANPLASGTRARLQQAAMLLGRVTHADPATRATLDALLVRTCAAMPASRSDGGVDDPMAAWAACYPVASALLESDVDAARADMTRAMLSGLVAMLREGLEQGQSRRVQRAAQRFAARLAAAAPAPTLGAPEASRLIVELARLEAEASASVRTSLAVWQTTLTQLEGIEGAAPAALQAARLELAERLLAAGQLDEARPHFEAVRAAAPVNDAQWTAALIGLASVEQAAGRVEAARALLDEALARPELEPEARARLEALRRTL